MESKTSNLIDLIKSRKSIRNFIYQKINKEIIRDILECGRWAPSGQNCQVWRVCVVIHPTVKRMVAEQTKYGGIIESAYVNFVIFLDIQRGYDRVKDLLAMGAFMQNILLGVHSHQGIGAVWIGEILEKKEQVNEIFKFPKDKFELMGVISIGYIDEAREKAREEERKRRSLEEFTDWY